MKNVTMEVSENILTIKADLSKRLGKSSSGKTTIVATTEGNVSVPDTDGIKIGLNIHVKE